MDNAGKCITVTFAVLAVFAGCRHCQEVSQGPSNSTVLSGSQARFNCTIKGDWRTIIWFQNDTPVLLIFHVGGVMDNASRFSAVNYSAPGIFTSELVLSDVRVNDSSLIKCNALSSDYFSAFLSVQVNGTVNITTSNLTFVANERALIVCQASGWFPAPKIAWLANTSPVDPVHYSTLLSDEPGGLQSALSTLNMTFAENETVTCLASIEALPGPQAATASLTVVKKSVEESKSLDNTAVILIAVLVTIGGLLLISIIVVIVICCRRRRRKEESSYQSQMKKVSAQKTNNISTISKNVAGSANPGYDEDPSAFRRPLPKIPPVNSNSIHSFETEQRYGRNHAFEAGRAYDEPQYPVNSLSLSRPAHLRHLTHV